MSRTPLIIRASDSFSGRTIRVRVSKKAGMEQRTLLADENENGGGIWKSISDRCIVVIAFLYSL